MKSILGQGQVQASNNLAANGGVLGAMVGMYARKKDYETRYDYQTSLLEFDDKLRERRQLTGTVHGIVADQARQATAHTYKTAQEAAAAKNKLDQIKAGGKEKRRTIGYTNKNSVKTMKDMTAGLETSAGLDLSGGISPLVAGPGQFQGQLQALKGHPHLGINPAQNAAQAPAAPAAPAPAAPAPAAAKGGRKRTKPFADPSVEKNVKPVPSEVASPFGAAGTPTRSNIFADASASRSNNSPAAETPDVATPKARIKKA
jgi:hypothetical protein